MNGERIGRGWREERDDKREGMMREKGWRERRMARQRDGKRKG